MILTLSYAKTLLGLTDATYDTEVTGILTATTRLFEKEAFRTIESASVTEYIDGDGGYAMWLREPAEAITSIKISSSADWTVDPIDSGDYLLDDMAVERVSGGVWTIGRKNIQVIYSAGFATIPDDIYWAAMSTLQTKWNLLRLGQTGKDILQSEKHDDWSQTIRQQMNLSKEVQEILHHYRPWGE